MFKPLSETSWKTPDVEHPSYQWCLERAAQMRDNARNSGTMLPIDDALAATWALNKAMVTPGITCLGQAGLESLEPTDFYRLAEGIDTVRTYGNEQQQNAALYIGRALHAVMPSSRNLGPKMGILQAFGIEAGPSPFTQ